MPVLAGTCTAAVYRFGFNCLPDILFGYVLVELFLKIKSGSYRVSANQIAPFSGWLWHDLSKCLKFCHAADWKLHGELSGGTHDTQGQGNEEEGSRNLSRQWFDCHGPARVKSHSCCCGRPPRGRGWRYARRVGQTLAEIAVPSWISEVSSCACGWS